MKKIICPSLMCANFENLSTEIKQLDAAGVDIYHIDIMDGSFAPNFAMGLHDLQAVRALTNNKIDVHLMINNPGKYIQLFIEAGADIVYIHPESDLHPARTLAQIKDMGAIAGIAINPGTSFESVKELLHIVIMS